ncbi:hypothetical protein IAT40_000620 [Kwoniella sp. CBS 6097]
MASEGSSTPVGVSIPNVLLQDAAFKSLNAFAPHVERGVLPHPPTQVMLNELRRYISFRAHTPATDCIDAASQLEQAILRSREADEL